MAVVRDTTTSWTTSDDATWRAWINAIHTALTGAGLVQTSDTGQFNLTTGVRPGTVDTLSGYLIYRFNDAEQATNPIFIKLTFYTGDAVTWGRFVVNIGKSSDGAGNLGSATGNLGGTTSGGGADSANRVIHACVADGALSFYAGANVQGTAGFFVIIERLRNAAGNFDGRVGVLTMLGISNTKDHRRWDGGWTEPTVGYSHPGIRLTPEGVVPVSSIFMSGCVHPFRAVLAAWTTEIGVGDSGDITVDGDARSYYAVGLCTNMLGEAFNMFDSQIDNGTCLLRNE